MSEKIDKRYKELDGADIHYLHRFFECDGIIVLDPTENNFKALSTRKNNFKQLNDILEYSSLDVIKEFVELGRSGLTKSITKLNVSVNLFSIKDMEKYFVAGGKLARNIQNPGFDEFIKKLKK